MFTFCNDEKRGKSNDDKGLTDRWDHNLEMSDVRGVWWLFKFKCTCDCQIIISLPFLITQSQIYYKQYETQQDDFFHTTHQQHVAYPEYSLNQKSQCAQRQFSIRSSCQYPAHQERSSQTASQKVI